MRKRNYIFILFGAVSILGIFMWFQRCHDKLTIEMTDEKKPIKFVFSDQELKDKLKWKNTSLEDMLQSAINGDSAALYNLGGMYLVGLNVPINMDMANTFFAKSASLGYGPALYQIAHKCLDEKNPFLWLVYVNLMIASGHLEFTVMYHQSRETILEDCDKKVAIEIENLAAKKMSVILENKCNLDQESDKSFYFLMQNITNEDSQYDEAYWSKFYLKNKNLVQDPWYLRIDSLDLNEDTKEFLTIVVDWALRIVERCEDISEVDIQNYLENRVPELMETKAGQIRIAQDLRDLNSIAIIKGQAAEEIVAEYGDTFKSLSRDFLEEELNRRVGYKVDKIIREFKSNIKH